LKPDVQADTFLYASLVPSLGLRFNLHVVPLEELS
jgi:hypothetical protein